MAPVPSPRPPTPASDGRAALLGAGGFPAFNREPVGWVTLTCGPCEVTWRGWLQDPCWSCGSTGRRRSGTRLFSS